MHTHRGRVIVVLRKTKGYVICAVGIVARGQVWCPSFGVGNTDCYQTYGLGRGARMWLRRHGGIALPLFHRRYGTPLPYRVPIDVLIGESIPALMAKVPGARPDDQLVDEYHAKYIERLPGVA
mmetsp:Transcript_5198/g.14735  ORF Transcript_5198/g.14735 Transcript_5198/m.14735 type:complete len:123 (-) Transcript_5198:58-426(-)